MESRLTLNGVSKSFGPVKAVKNVSFTVAPGSAHALIGENGAGKSTLVKMITGMLQADEGEILLDGVHCNFGTPIEARRAGITAVYQDPKLFPHLDVAENIFMGIYPKTKSGLIDKAAMYREAQRGLEELGVDIDPHSPLAGKTVAEIQFVEIVRAMIADLKVLFLDEPTASLTPTEAERFFRIVKSLTSSGVSVVFISHRLHEIKEVCDSVTILRDGEHIHTGKTKELDEHSMVQLMVGRNLSSLFVRVEAPVTDEPLFEVKDLSLENVFEDVNFSIKGGEVVGMAGLVGAGRTEIAETIFGIRKPTSGSVVVNGIDAVPKSPRQMMKLGIAYIPEDRDLNGAITSLGVSDNICLAALDRVSKAGFTKKSTEQVFSGRYAKDFEIKTSGLDSPVSSLSGGNRQKVVLAKWMATVPKVLILDEPTHGIDVGTKSQVHQRVSELASAGYPVLLISSDLPEILGMSDRVLVVAGGKIVAEFSKEEATQEKIIEAASVYTKVVFTGGKG